jgi:endonuclease/exonuclease/phosphatase family metal-dependent hydrolase
MLKFIQIFFVLVLFISNDVEANKFTIMSINAQNLFDTIDDPKKDDKAFLPLELKQSQGHKNECNNISVKRWRIECFFQDWDEETKNAKLNNLMKVIISYGGSGADIVGLQEIENINILDQLFQLLKPYGYSDFKLLESNDKRGIDTAFISKYKIKNSKLHYVNFSPKFETIDTRPIFEVDIEINNQLIKFYNVHFPSNFHPTQMRIESFDKLKSLISNHSYPSIALGDFNLTNKDDNKFNIYKGQEDFWDVAHREGCGSCKGTYYYGKGKSWDFLDTIMVSKDRGINFNQRSINVFKTEFNTYKDTGKPFWFNPENKQGVSDHFPIVAEISIN